MNRKVIGPVIVEWSEHLLIVRWTLVSLWSDFGFETVMFCWFFISGLRFFYLKNWFGVTSSLLIILLCAFVVSANRKRCEKVIADRVTDCVRDIWTTRHKKFSAVTQDEYCPLKSLSADLSDNRYHLVKRYGVMLKRVDGKIIEPLMLMEFKKEEQAQEVADILNAFLRQPETTEAPGVWPPPPRIPPAPS